MSLFRRDRPSDPDGPADPHLPPLSAADADHLTDLARREFDAVGIQVEPDGQGALVAEHATYGLGNLAALAGGLPRRRWRKLVRAHVQTILDAEDDSSDDSEDGILYFKLRPLDHIDTPPRYAPEVLPGILLVSAVDHPTHVRELLSDDHLDEYGGWDEAYRTGLANLRELPDPEHTSMQGIRNDPATEVHLFATDDFFGASRIAILPELLGSIGIERPSHGVLIGIPNRHLLTVHVVSGDGLLAALRTMIKIGHAEHDGREGAITPEVFYRAADGETQQLTWTTDEQSVQLRVSGRFAEVLDELDLALGE